MTTAQMTDADPDMLRVYLLGGFRVERNGEPVPVVAWQRREAARNLVKLLAVTPEHRLHREQVIDALWPDADFEAGQDRLRKMLHVARAALEPERPPRAPSAFLGLTDDLLSLRRTHVWIDADHFEALARDALTNADVAQLEAAAAAYTGQLLPEDRFADWAAARRQDLAERYLQVLMALAEALAQRGAYGRAIEYLLRALQEERSREEVHRRLMQLYARSGSRHSALRQYEICRQALRDDLDLEPEPETQDLYQEILAGELAPAAGSPEPANSRLPLPGAARRALEGERTVPLVGRDDVHAQLDAHLDACRSGRGTMLVIGGEPGVGKTRLTAEFTRGAWRNGAVVLWGTSYEHEGTSVYGPLVEALEEYVEHTDGAARGEGPLANYPELQALLPGSAVPSQPTSPSAPDLGAQGDQRRLFASVARFLSDLSARAPVILVLDDLHAADAATIQLLQYLMRLASDRCWLLIGTYRAAEAQATSDFGRLLTAGERAHVLHRISLAALDRDACDQLVYTLLADTRTARTPVTVPATGPGGSAMESSALVDRIYARTLGNPLFVGELIRSLQDGTEDERSDDGALPVPRYVRDMIEERIGGLGDDVGPVLALAAVVGDQVSYDVLAATARAAFDPPLSSAQLLDRLDRALGARILDETRDGYTFRHPLFRETLYDGLSRRRRLYLHASLGATIEELHPDDVETLAFHYSRSDDEKKAIYYLERAGDRAHALYAVTAAERYYREVLTRLEQRDRREDAMRLRVKLGSVLSALSRFDEAGPMLDEALDHFRQNDDADGLGRALAIVCDVYAGRGEAAAGIDRAAPLMRVVEQGGPTVTLANLYVHVGRLLFAGGDYEGSAAYALRAIELCDAMDETPEMLHVLARAEAYLGTAQSMLGHEHLASDALRRAISLAEQLDLPETLTIALGNLASAEAERGNLPEARDLSARALAAAERLGDLSLVIAQLTDLGSMLNLLGDWPGARRHLERALSLPGATEELHYTRYALLQLAELDLAEGRWEDALARVTQAVDVEPKRDDLQLRRYACMILAEHDLLLGNAPAAIRQFDGLLDRPGSEESDVTYVMPTVARAHVEAAGSYEERREAATLVERTVERARRHNHNLALTFALRTQGVVLAQEKRMAEARRAFDEATAIARAMPNPYDEGRALCDAGESYTQQGFMDEARSHLERARTIFERLGARPYLERTLRALELIEATESSV